MHLNDLKRKKIGELTQIAKDLNVDNATGIAQAGADLRDTAVPRRQERADLRGGHTGDPAGGLRFSAIHGLQLPARAGRHLCLPLTDQEVWSAHGGHHLGPDTAPKGQREILRAPEDREDQLRRSGGGKRQDHLRQPHAYLSVRADQAGDWRRRSCPPARHGPLHARSARGSGA